jgi:hypothetical protein
MRAIVDETRVSPTTGAEGLLLAFKGLADVLQRLRADQIQLLKHSTIWEVQILEQTPLFQILFVDGYLDRDVRLLVSLELERLTDCNTENDVPSARDFALQCLAQGRPCGLIVVPCHTGVEQHVGMRLHSIGNYVAAIKFYREAPELGNFTEAQFVENFQRSFPQLYFRGTIADDLDKFSQSYQAMRPTLMRALADLNDQLPPLRQLRLPIIEIERRFNASSEFSISPESPQTHKDAAAMRQRNVMFGNNEICCEWHLKIQPDRDRIHFHFGVPGIAGNKILIGIFCLHLK